MIESEEELENLLKEYDDLIYDSQRIIQLHSAKFYHELDYHSLRIWCIYRAIYQLPTIELIEYLSTNVNLEKAIEIGEGNNYLYHHLGIRGIDNYFQQIPKVKLVHELLGETPTSPPPEVEKMDAIEAINLYQPEVVITAWATLKYEDKEIDTGNRYAPDEDEILSKGVTYIHIGNHNIHGERKIMSQPHQTFYFDWLVSRAKDPAENCIYAWNKD
jgi:hypothetical protein